MLEALQWIECAQGLDEEGAEHPGGDGELSACIRDRGTSVL